MTVRLFTLSGALFASKAFPVGASRTTVNRWIDRQDSKYGAYLRRDYNS